MAETLLRRSIPEQKADDDADVGLIYDNVTGQIVGFYGHNDTDDTVNISYAIGALTERASIPPHTKERMRVDLPPSRRSGSRPIMVADRPFGKSVHPWNLGLDRIPTFDSFSMEREYTTRIRNSPTVASAAYTEFFSSATTTHNVPQPSTVVAGDGLATFFFIDTASDVTVSGYVRRGDVTNTDRLFGHVRVAVGDEDSVNVNHLTTTASFAIAHMYRIDAGTWAGAVDGIKFATSTGTSATPDPANLDIGTSNDALWLACAAKVSGTVTSAPTSFTDLINGSAGANMGSARRTNTASSENPGTFGGTTSSAYMTITMAVLSDTWDFGPLPYLVSVGTQFSGTGATSGALPGGIAANDLLVWVMETEGEDANAEPIPDSWVALNDIASATDSVSDRTRLTVARIFYSGSPPDLTSTDPGDHHVGYILAFRNVDTTSPVHIQQTSSDSSNDTAMSITGVTTTLDNCLIVYVESNGDDDVVGGAVSPSDAANASLDFLLQGGRAGTTSSTDGSVGVWYGGKASQGATGTLTGTIQASEESASISFALAPAAAVEPEFEVELASEGDAATDAVLRTEPRLTAEQGAENDTAADASLLAEPLLLAEQAAEGDVAQDIEIAVEQGLVAEQASESDTAFDVVLAAEPSLINEQADESDAALDVVLLVEPLLSVELGGESDVATELGLTSEPLLAVELATERDVAADVKYREFAADLASELNTAADVLMAADVAEPSFVVEAGVETYTAIDVTLATESGLIAEQATEVEVADDVALAAEPLFAAEQAAENDAGADPALQTEPLLIVDSAAEADAAGDVDMSVLSEFAAEQAEEFDTAAEVMMTVELVFITELAGESAVAVDTDLETEQVITIDLADEPSMATDVSLSAELAIVVESAVEHNIAADVLVENLLTEIIVELAYEQEVAFDVVFVVYFIRFDPVNQLSKLSQGSFASNPTKWSEGEYDNDSSKWSRGEFN